MGQEPKRVFISYSSVDKEFASRLASDLQGLGIRVWIDDWEIGVGDNIIQRINSGLLTNQYLIVVLSPDSVASLWVQEELAAKLYEDFAERKISVLPVLIHDCEIPPLLRSRSFADFRADYYFGFRRLAKRILGQSIDSYEKRGWARSFLGSSVSKSYGSAFFFATLITAFFYKVSSRLNVFGSFSPTYRTLSLTCRYIFYINTVLAIGFLLLWILYLFISGERRTHSVLLHRPTSSTFPSSNDRNIAYTSGRASSFVTERIESAGTAFPDGPARSCVNVTILFSVWNRSSTRRIKIYDIKTDVYGSLSTIRYCNGPRTMVIVDEDKSFIDQDRTVEVPPTESASFNVAYRVSTNHGEYVVFGLIVCFHDDSGQKQEVRSDSIYVCREDEILTIDESNYRDVLEKNAYARFLLERAYARHFALSNEKRECS